MVSWPQSAYVRRDTLTACLPTLREDVQKIFDAALPGCQLPKIKHLNVRNHSAPDASLCAVVGQIYKADVRLWEERCGQSRFRG